MASERIKGNVSFSCDTRGCNEDIETDYGDFLVASGVAKAEGWVFRKRGAEWKHYCCSNHEDMDFRGKAITKAKLL